MGLLDGRVAFVTGGASGIGRSVALRFAEEGADVVLADLQDDEGEEARREVESRGRGAAFVRCDVSDPEDVERAVGTAIERFGRLDIVFANAGINGVWAPIEDLRPEEWDTTLAVNLKGTFLTVRAAIPHLKAAGGGSVIITSSVNGTRTFSNPGASAYSASKAGQVAFSRMAALELGRHGIRVNSVLPGFIHTNIDERTEKRNTEEIEIEMELPEGIPAIDGGVGEAVEVADTCLFLASDLARHVSGVEIYVDGGASLLR
jgi:NAD(P)-dependent dehydrogenase (short-subunit alcohol dehydrogenase family)